MKKARDVYTIDSLEVIANALILRLREIISNSASQTLTYLQCHLRILLKCRCAFLILSHMMLLLVVQGAMLNSNDIARRAESQFLCFGDSTWEKN